MPEDIPTIDHGTLSRLVAAATVRSAQVVSAASGWHLRIKQGSTERILTARRGETRSFRKLETVVSYLKALGLSKFEVDSAGYDPSKAKTTRRRPDRVEALRRAHAAVGHDRWFRAQVQTGIDDLAAGRVAPHEEVMERLRAKLPKRRSMRVKAA